MIHQPLDDDLLFGAGKFWGPAVASVLQAVKQLEGIKTEGVLQIPPQTSRKPLGNPRIKVDVKAAKQVSRCLKFQTPVLLAVLTASHCVSTLREGKDVVKEVVEGKVATSSVLTAGR